MLTLILPGLSPHNKDWAIQTKENLKLPSEIVACEWKHWKTGGALDVDYEAGQIISLIGSQRVNFIAKSAGTSVFMRVLPKIINRVEKIILCGIPMYPPEYLRGLTLLTKGSVEMFQNSGDPLVPYKLIEKYIHTLDKDIPVIEKQAETHDYPYFTDFQKFLQ
jgi:hypothetical protein